MFKKYGKKIAACLAIVMLVASAMGGTSLEAKAAPKMTVVGENIISNPNFAGSDLSMWSGSGATLTQGSQSDEILPGVTTFATVSGRNQGYQGFSQDITGSVKAGEIYQVEYYVKLSDSYGSATKSFFGPYVTTQAGEDKYLSQEYSSWIQGNLLQTCKVGEWTKFSGTFTIPDDEPLSKVVIRIQEEASSNRGDYSVTGVSMRLMEEGAADIETDIPTWKSAITAALGEDTIAGFAFSPNGDKTEYALVKMHGNAMTFGNEMKPDYMFGYSNNVCPGKETITFNGVSLLVPIIQFSKTDRLCDKVLEYNAADPENALKLRGHTLLWHAQTPEWFFHENYDASQPYVSTAVMDMRMEWYIKSMLEHYVGPNSKYKDLFYGWDVLNEAASDGGDKVYRDDLNGNDKLTDSTHGSKSSWWHIYQSNDYIIKAFTYANKYAPATLELYYNDYGDASPTKSKNICELLKAIKEHEGAPGVGTRVDAMGMQGHYSMSDFNIKNFEAAAISYLDIVGKIQLTELDFKASSSYDGTEATRQQEYTKQAVAYKQIFDTLVKLDGMDGYDVNGITMWGVTDPNSWLQSSSNVGGGSDGKQSQVPLLFDGNYMTKPAFWAFVDANQLVPSEVNVELCESEDGNYEKGNAYTITLNDGDTTILPIWDKEGLKIQVNVKDKTNSDEDSVTLYVDLENTRTDSAPATILKAARADGKTIGGGYSVEFLVPVEKIYAGMSFGLDVVVNDNGDAAYLADIRGKQDNSTRYYANAVLKPALGVVRKGTAVIDGEKDEIWATADTFKLGIRMGTKASGSAQLLWDEENLYIYATIKDAVLNTSSADAYRQDSLEIYLDENNDGGEKYLYDDKVYRINCENVVTAEGKKGKTENVTSFVKKTEDGYIIEAAIRFIDAKPKVNREFGFDLRLNDADENGKRVGILNWYDHTNSVADSPAVFGTIKLSNPGKAKTPEEQEDTSSIATEGSADEPSSVEVSENGTASQGINAGAIAAAVAAVVVVILAAVFVIVKKKKKS